MFKQKDVLSETEALDIQDNDTLFISKSGYETYCTVCALHAKAYDVFKEMIENDEGEQTEDFCPVCNSVLSYSNRSSDHVVVGGHNVYSPDENIGYYKLRYCTQCNKDFALMPEEINYNANHGIFTTGGNRFLSDNDADEIRSIIQESFKRNTEDFVKRVKEGDKMLDAWNLEYWNMDEIMHAVAHVLYEKGLKK